MKRKFKDGDVAIVLTNDGMLGHHYLQYALVRIDSTHGDNASCEGQSKNSNYTIFQTMPKKELLYVGRI